MPRKLHYLLNRRRLQRELADELEAHRAEMGDRARSFGSALKLREESNDAWGFAWFDHLIQDLHYGARILRKSPAFTLTAVAILALGIGLNITAFGFVNTLMLRPLNVKDPETMVRLIRSAPGAMSDGFSYPSFDFYRRNNRVFSSMWAIGSGELLLDTGATVSARFVTPDFFREMGGPAPSLPHGNIAISHKFWSRALGSDPGAVGRKIRLNQFTAVIAEVLPANFISVEPDPLDLWIPMTDYAISLLCTRSY